MATIEFDKKFEKITAEMVEIAFELLEFQQNDVDTIYIIGSIEENTFSYNFFFNINGSIVTAKDINEKAKQRKYNIDKDRIFALLKLGNSELKKLDIEFKNDKREAPKLLKILFWPKTGKFECTMSYELQFSYSDNRSFYHVFTEWFEEEKKKSELGNISK